MQLDPAALSALKNGQRQLDADGCEVGVSRQALDEMIAAYESFSALLPEDEAALVEELLTLKAGFAAEITEGSRQEFAASMGPMRAYWLQTDHTRLMAENGNMRAQLAEANKALEEIIERDQHTVYPENQPGRRTDGPLARIARRAREQGGENV